MLQGKEGFLDVISGNDGSFTPNALTAIKWTWLLVLGQEGTELENMDPFGWFMFWVATIILLIVMLNVLIAIASNSY